MIHPLLSYIATLLPGAGLPGGNAILLGGTPVAAPGVGLWAGPVEASREASDLSSSKPRPQGKRMEFASPINMGPYPLGKAPLQGSVLCRLVVSAGQDERRLLLTEGNHFTVAYPQGEITLLPGLDLTKAKALEVEYSFVGVFTVREFVQEFYIEAAAATPEKAEEMASLCATVLLTNHDEALADFNANAGYSGGDYESTHSLSQVQWLGGKAYSENNSHRYRLTFAAKGQLKAIKGDPGSFGIIQEIRSPGETTDPDTRPVSIEPELG